MTDHSLPAQTWRVGALLASAGAPPLGPHAITVGADGHVAALQPIESARLTPAESALVAMPALANAHDHGRGLRTLACGIADAPLESWMVQLAHQPRVDPYDTAALAFARMAGSGVASVYHCHNTQDGSALLAEAEAVSRAARDVGIRVAFGWPFFDANPLVYGSPAALADFFPPAQREGIIAMDRGLRGLATNMALFEAARAFEHAGFTLAFHPVAPQWTRPETLAAIARASAETGRRVHTHLLETRLQREWADHHFPQGFVPWLDGVGLLSPRLTVAHGVWLRPDEIALLAQRGVTVAVNVSSNLRLRSGLPPLADLAREAVALGLGLDGMALDDDEDMLRELRLAHLMLGQPCRHESGPVPLPDPAAALRAVWEDGRRAILGADGGGRIAVGAPADLLLLDRSAMAPDYLGAGPANLPTSAEWLLARATRAHVAHLLVAGRQVIANGQPTGVNEAALSARLIAATARAVAAFYETGAHRQPD